MWLDGSLTHIKQQSILQVGQKESETVNDGKEVELDAELFIDSGVDNTCEEHEEEHDLHYCENVEIHAIFIADGTD